MMDFFLSLCLCSQLRRGLRRVEGGGGGGGGESSRVPDSSAASLCAGDVITDAYVLVTYVCSTSARAEVLVSRFFFLPCFCFTSKLPCFLWSPPSLLLLFLLLFLFFFRPHPDEMTVAETPPLGGARARVTPHRPGAALSKLKSFYLF